MRAPRITPLCFEVETNKDFDKYMKKKTQEKPKKIIPYRYLPFDLGMSIDSDLSSEIKSYFKRKGFENLTDTVLLSAFSKYFLYGVKISDDINLYIYSFGIGVFAFRDDEFSCESNRYALFYGRDKKEKYESILSKKPHHKFSPTFAKVSDDLRKLTSNYLKDHEPLYKKLREKHYIRRSANSSWEYAGFSYLMSTSFIFDDTIESFEYEDLNTNYKKNLIIMLEPSVANLEESNLLDVEASDDPYGFSIDEYSPKDWIKKSDTAVYISWSAVVSIIKDPDDEIIGFINSMEVDLQAMWFYTYCMYDDTSNLNTSEFKIFQLKTRLFEYKKMYAEFKLNVDYELPGYIFEIRNELINTSRIDNQCQRFTEYLDFRMEETTSRNLEERQRFDTLSQILLFAIAYIQGAPLIYKLLMGEYLHFGIPQSIFIVLLAILGVVWIIKKDNM